MIESPHRTYSPLQLPSFSLYSETRRPTSEMLDGIDHLIIDLQDVGTRVYTFIWTMLECLRACAAEGIAVTVLDRPNPLGGSVFEGPILSAGFLSFVGNAQIPMRHGLTIGEMARLFVSEQEIDVELQVIPLRNWESDVVGWQHSESWVPPSPNMPRPETAVLYPGQVLLEGTNLSEGRGTTYPFEVVGAPYLQADDFASEINRSCHPGVIVRPVRFRPVFDKWSGQICQGVRIHITDLRAVRSFELTVAILKAASLLALDQFKWLAPPYEYEHELPPIDILYGSNRLRTSLHDDSCSGLAACEEEVWKQRTGPIRLYPVSY